MFFGSNIILVVYFPYFYSVPAAASLVFTEFALICWLKVGELHSRRDYFFFFLGSFLMTLNLASRPQLAIGFLLAIPLFYKSFLSLTRSNKIGILGLLLLAILLVAIPLGFYNYDRFGSPFNLGVNYNLTGYDIANFHVDWRLYPLLFFYYLLNPPVPIPEFPFLRNAFAVQMGLDAMIEPTISGYFFLLPVSFLLFSLPKKWMTIRNWMLKGVLIACIVGTCIVITFDVYKVGVLFRYFSDFGWLLSIAVVLVLNLHITQLEDVGDAKAYRVFMVLCAICFIISVLLWFFGLLSPRITWHQTDMSVTNPQLYEWLKQLFSV